MLHLQRLLHQLPNMHQHHPPDLFLQLQGWLLRVRSNHVPNLPHHVQHLHQLNQLPDLQEQHQANSNLQLQGRLLLNWVGHLSIMR